jgi:heat shock protein HslJ
MRRFSFAVWLCVALLSLMHRANAQTSALQDPNLRGVKWLLVAIDGQQIEHKRGLVEFVGDAAPIQRFVPPEEATVRGGGLCNSLFTSYSIQSAGQIQFAQLNSTVMSCSPDSLMKAESRLMNRMERAMKYRVDSGDSTQTLILFDNAGEELLRFNAMMVRIFVPLVSK